MPHHFVEAPSRAPLSFTLGLLPKHFLSYASSTEGHFMIIKYGIVCYLDVYGYSAEANSANATEAAKRLFEMWKGVGAYILNMGKIDFTALSDSIFLGFDANGDTPSLIFESKVTPTIQHVIGQAAKYGYLLRGSAAYGQYYIFDNIVGGDAVIRAHKNEAITKIPIFLVPRAEITKINKESDSQVPFCCHEFQTRNGGLMQAVLIMPNPLDDCINLIGHKLDAAFEEGNFDIAAPLKSALRAYGYE